MALSVKITTDYGTFTGDAAVDGDAIPAALRKLASEVAKLKGEPPVWESKTVVLRWED